MSSIVHAYGGEHEALSYRIASQLAIDVRDTDVEHRLLALVPVSTDGYELVGFFVDADGYEFQNDSDYVTIRIGRKLLRAGLVVPSVCVQSMQDYDDPALIARLTREQFGDF
jgi:hypothetical protein